MKNTRLKYMYRDGFNFKNPGTLVFRGALGDGHLKDFLSALNDDMFIAHQIGVPEKFDWRGDEADHVWHEFYKFEATDDPPTDDRTITQFIEQTIQASKDGWKDGWTPGDKRP